MTFFIAPIVEGVGEEEAVPVLIRRFAERYGCTNLTIRRPFRVKRQRAVAPGEIERAVKFLRTADPPVSAIIILLDADEDCPATLGPELKARAEAVSNGIPVGVILANREYEAWFLAALNSLRGYRGVKPNAQPPANPETIVGAKEYFRRQLVEGASYSPSLDQAKFSAKIDLDQALTAASFRKWDREMAKLFALALVGG